MVIKLIYKDKVFTEAMGESAADSATAVLAIDETNGKALLTFSPEANLVERRTAQRQANSICKTGYLLSSGERVGGECMLDIAEEDQLPDRLLQEGHRFK